MADIRRIYGSKEVEIPAGSSLASEPVDMRRVAKGTILSASAWDAANIGFKVASASDGTPVALYDANAQIVEIVSPSVSVAFELPDELYSSHYVWLWSQSASGTNVDQTAAATITVLLKS